MASEMFITSLEVKMVSKSCCFHIDTVIPSILLSTNDDWPSVERNLQRKQVKWGWMAKILGREGAD